MIRKPFKPMKKQQTIDVEPDDEMEPQGAGRGSRKPNSPNAARGLELEPVPAT